MNTVSKPVVIETIANRIFYKCPKCKKPITFKKKYLGKSLCMKCGQRLDWSSFDRFSFETVHAEDSDMAAWVAERYYSILGTPESERFDDDNWRKSLNIRGTDLYLIFEDKKKHGTFMREFSKEGIIYDG